VKNLIYGLLFYFVGQTIIWFQSNGQFIWPWFKNNPIILSIFSGSIVSYMFILGTQYLYTYFGGIVWPGRFIGFSIGIFIFALFAWYFLGEGVNMKTLISLVLAGMLIAIQLFWK